MSSVLVLHGSPAADSRTALAAAHLADLLAADGVPTAQLAVRDLPAAELLTGRTDHPGIRAALDAVAAADGLIVATPIYQAAYTGLLKCFLDAVPQNGLAGKTVLPVGTGGTIAHLLALDYALRPVLTALGARHVVTGCFLLDQDVERGPADPATGRSTLAGLRPEAELRLLDALHGFTLALPPRLPSPRPALVS
ncbi:NADPH-dependent FMN reductase [Kitasatospora sp. MMS16-BH015]|uniref:NADPH-dependent FMN reductase n=1 Tax=Kitasatospora sp. MMS16-BH015 TaxID=2018025 RepID=UPI000CA3D3D1|nr:NADPH-dependent FMN reductase [Kitasatospora sp. MMS16-BH015]AUG80560.1 NADPH-dependent FMN reductase [Kitasatospora sp. MMS16-BH015]